ncbi:MAG: hypothetical protein IJ496_06605 [Ruminococcus sp.]|nr:hypothetical protein [Ruminococcus sp.]
MRMNNVKRALCIAIIAVAVIACTGCSAEEAYEVYEETYITTTDGIFTTIKKGDCCEIVYENETMVMYIKSTGHKNTGSFTLLVNADGTPRIYEEDEE